MNHALRKDAEAIARAAIASVSPDEAVRRALDRMSFPGRVFLVAVGKAAWQMAAAAVQHLQAPLDSGIVITKYEHVMNNLDKISCYEAGHPVPDENSFLATQAVLDLTANLQSSDTVLFLLSGGGSALFEKPLIPAEELQRITQRLLASGADITEMNTIRKRLSAVKGGRFALWCQPARIEAVILSDILGDPLDMIASGPAAADPSTCEQAQSIAEKYNLYLSERAQDCLRRETPKSLDNVTSQVVGSVRELCSSAARECEAYGYTPLVLTDILSCEAREAGRFLASILRTHAENANKFALLAGGETVVHLRGTGLGGRNQELALAAAAELSGLHHAAIISLGSDGTDGPTDAAGGYVDGDTAEALRLAGIDLFSSLENNDAYHALGAIGGLIKTGPTGTNVNDITIALLAKS